MDSIYIYTYAYVYAAADQTLMSFKLDFLMYWINSDACCLIICL